MTSTKKRSRKTIKNADKLYFIIKPISNFGRPVLYNTNIVVDA